MGLDKKPTPPPKRVKEEIIVTRPLDTGKDTAEVEEEMIGKDSHSQPEPETTQPQDMETEIKEDIPQEEDKPKDGTLSCTDGDLRVISILYWHFGHTLL